MSLGLAGTCFQRTEPIRVFPTSEIDHPMYGDPKVHDSALGHVVETLDRCRDKEVDILPSLFRLLWMIRDSIKRTTLPYTQIHIRIFYLVVGV